jgi:segregation and condensation protein A
MFRISLEEFEGPLDLLLFFIRRDELDIYNIPISRITSDFVSYISNMRAMNLEVAAEFIYMASMLMSIKAKMLLPRPEPDGGDSDEFDPRTELVQKLLEYRQMKEAAEKLAELADERARLFPKGFYEAFDPHVIDELSEEMHRPTLYHLITAYRSVLENIPKPMTRNVMEAPVTVEEQSALILSCLRERVQVSFRSVLEGIQESIILVVTFLAVLELCRNRKIIVLVKDGYDDFWMARRDDA